MKPIKMKMLLILLILLSLTGCSFLSPVKTTPDCTYMITSIPTNTPHLRALPITLMVMQPDAVPAYNTTEMAYSRRIYQIAYFAKNRWAETPPQMLQQLIVQTLQNTHRFRFVVTPPFTGTYDYVLSTTILQLEQDFVSCPVLKLRVRAQLINTTSNRVIATKNFALLEPIFAITPYNGVIAANIATRKFLSELSDFCIRNLL